MASPDESPEHGYPRPDKSLAGPAARERSPRFAFNASPSPSYRYEDRPLSPPLMFRNAVLQDRRRRRFPNTTTSTTSSRGKFLTFLIVTSLILLFLVIFISIPITVFYIFGPRAPTFSVEQVSICEPIFYESSTRFSSMINITMKVNNPAKHIGVFYESDNSIVASYSGMRLSRGMIPPFFQRPMQDMFMQSALTGVGVVVPDDVKHKLETDHKNQRVPLALDMMGMVRYKMGAVTSRAVLKVSCDLVLENLWADNSPQIFSRSCDSIAGFWFANIRN